MRQGKFNCLCATSLVFGVTSAVLFTSIGWRFPIAVESLTLGSNTTFPQYRCGHLIVQTPQKQVRIKTASNIGMRQAILLIPARNTSAINVPTLYELDVSINWPVLVLLNISFILLPLIWIRKERDRNFRMQSMSENRCIKCGYDLRATLERCPEYGMIVAAKEVR